MNGALQSSIEQEAERVAGQALGRRPALVAGMSSDDRAIVVNLAFGVAAGVASCLVEGAERDRRIASALQSIYC